MDVSTPATDAELERRAARHRALGDVRRLMIVDALRHHDRTPGELGERTGLPTNLVAFHLDVLAEAGLIERVASEGDARRRYVRMVADAPRRPREPRVLGGAILFVCTHNASRSQLAAALWTARTGRSAFSAGREPAPTVDPVTVAVAAEHGLDLGAARPRGYDQVPVRPELVVTVCDRAGEAGPPFADVPHLHWSVPDPVGGGRAAVEDVHDHLAARIEALAADVEVVA